MKKTLFDYFTLGKKPGKIPELDGLRAWAILLVLGHHFATFYREHNGSYYRQVLSGSLENWLLNGWLGVDLFFVLSGYLIFHHLLSVQGQQNRSSVYRRYALKRILRTFPLYYAMILIALLGIIPQFQPSVSWADLLVHVVFLQDYLGAVILVPMWSLATEEKFYLLAPLLLVFTRWPLKRSLTLLLVIMLGLVTFRTVQLIQSESVVNHIQFFLQYRAPFHYAVVAILVGVVIALIEQQRTPSWLSAVSLLTGVVVVVSLLLFNFYQPTHWHWLSVTHFVMVLLFGVLVWSAVKLTGSGWLSILRGRFLRVVAVLSYTLYLVHYAVLPWAFKLHKQYIISETPWIHAGSFLLIYIGISVMVSLLLHYLVEKPFLLLKARL